MKPHRWYHRKWKRKTFFGGSFVRKNCNSFFRFERLNIFGASINDILWTECEKAQIYWPCCVGTTLLRWQQTSNEWMQHERITMNVRLMCQGWDQNLVARKKFCSLLFFKILCLLYEVTLLWDLSDFLCGFRFVYNLWSRFFKLKMRGNLLCWGA